MSTLLTLVSMWDLKTGSRAVDPEATGTTEDFLDLLFHDQQDDRKPFPSISSMSAGDVVIVTTGPRRQEAWLCDSFGWSRLTATEFSSWLRADPRDRSLRMWEKVPGSAAHGEGQMANLVPALQGVTR